MLEVLDWHTKSVGGRPRAVLRGTSLPQRGAGKSEQAPVPLGFDHVVGAEAEAVQVFNQTGPLARVGDPKRFKRIKIQGINHLSKCARRPDGSVAGGRV
jgi:hypothetical protein